MSLVIPDALMSHAAFARVRAHVRLPHVLDVRRGTGRLTLIGVAHTHDLHDPVLGLIRQRWRRVRPDAAWVEGGYPTLLRTVEDTVGAYGEAGFLASLARWSMVPTRTLEPWRLDEARHLWQRWDREPIKLFYLLRDLDTWHRGHRAVPLDVHAQVLLDNLSRGAVAGRPRVVDEVDDVARRWLPGGADWRSCPSSWWDPAEEALWTQRVSRASSRYRDAVMLSRLTAALDRGENALAVVGFAHSVMQAPVWRQRGRVREVGGLPRQA